MSHSEGADINWVQGWTVKSWSRANACTTNTLFNKSTYTIWDWQGRGGGRVVRVRSKPSGAPKSGCFQRLFWSNLRFTEVLGHHLFGVDFVWAGTWILMFCVFCVGNRLGAKSNHHGIDNKNGQKNTLRFEGFLFVLSCHWWKCSYPCYGGLKTCYLLNLLLSARHTISIWIYPHGMESQK